MVCYSTYRSDCSDWENKIYGCIFIIYPAKTVSEGMNQWLLLLCLNAITLQGDCTFRTYIDHAKSSEQVQNTWCGDHLVFWALGLSNVFVGE